MKTTIDIPEKELRDVMKFTKAKTKREAVNAVIADFNQRNRQAALIKYAAICTEMMTLQELMEMHSMS